MDNCRACGENSFANQNEHDQMEKLSEIYYKLTGMQLENMDSGRLLFCSGCIRDLDHFDRFRKKCLEVYQRLQDLKVEVWQEDYEPIAVKVELIEGPSVIPKSASATVATATNDKDKDKQKDESSDEDIREDDDDDDDDDDDGIGVDVGDDEGDDSEGKLESNNEHDKKNSKKRNRNSGGSPRSKDKSKTKPVDPNKKSSIKFNCPRCPKKFFFEHRLEAHVRIHDGLKPFLCKLCGKSFVNYKNIKTHHIQIHTDTKISMPCGFPGCDAVLTTKHGLKYHHQRYHDPNYQAPEIVSLICDLCGKSFTRSGALKRHKYTHNPEEMPFACSFCGKKFPTNVKLQDHTKRHQGIKDFACPQCGLQKPSQHEVNQHIKNVHEKHLRTEPISCTVCNTVFSSKPALKRHIDVVHLKIKKFSCSICGFMFSQKDHLNRHMKSHKAKEIGSLPIASHLHVTDEDI